MWTEPSIHTLAFTLSFFVCPQENAIIHKPLIMAGTRSELQAQGAELYGYGCLPTVHVLVTPSLHTSPQHMLATAGRRYGCRSLAIFQPNCAHSWIIKQEALAGTARFRATNSEIADIRRWGHFIFLTFERECSMWTEGRLDELLGARSEMWKACSDCLPEGVSVNGSTFVFLEASLQVWSQKEYAKQQEEILLSR